MIINVVVVALILLPNFSMFIWPPEGMPYKPPKVPIVMTSIENIGRFLCVLSPLYLLEGMTVQSFSWLFGIMLICIVLYYIGWGRYLLSGRQYKMLFEPFLKILIPMAICPIIYFMCFSILTQSIILGIAAVLFAVGHIYISWETYKSLT